MHFCKISISVIVIILIVTCGVNGQFCEFLENVSVENINENCLKQLDIVCKNGSLFWKFFDASSKLIKPGLTYSNNINYGNFHECLDIEHAIGTDEEIRGKYCGLSVVVPNVASFIFDDKTTPLRIDNDVKNQIKNRIMPLNTNSYLRAPDSSTIDVYKDLLKLSSCIPDACSPQEVADFFIYGYLLGNVTVYTELDCETKLSNTELEGGDIAFIIVVSAIILVIIGSTVYDVHLRNNNNKPAHQILIAFSLVTNTQKLIEINHDSKEQIQCFNGMRFISMMWILAYHAVIPFQRGVYSILNWQDVLNWEASWWNRYILSALLAVDTFFFMSGFLLAYGYLRSSSEKSFWQHLREVPSMYFHRYLRLTPALAAMYFLLITVYRMMGSGPLWTAINGMFRETCKKYWWQFFLYVQNYTNYDTMCVNPMWYLSADMQIFILSPLVLIPTAMYIRRHFIPTIVGLTVLTVLWIFFPMIIRFSEGDIGNTYGAHERFNVFLIGFVFGAVMRIRRDQRYIFSPLVNLVLWIASIGVSLAFNIYWWDVVYNYEFVKYTLFIGLYRPVWCICLVFMVYSCYCGYGGIVNWFLSRPIFQILGRLSYSMYVLHVIVEVYAGGQVSTDQHFSNYVLFYNWCGHFVVTMVAAVVWVLMFEMPMITIGKTIRGLSGSSAKRKTKV